MASISPTSQTSGSEVTGNYRIPLAVLTSLFFMWGFITCMNDILIPSFKEMFDLNYFEAFLVQFAFFGAYFLGSLAYFLISITSGDPIQKFGYKNGILAGLVVSAVACLLFFPAAQTHLYGFFLGALFLLGIGFTLLQIAANPYVAILGPERSASSRLNLAQAFNSFGTTIAPLIGGYFVFEVFKDEITGKTSPEAFMVLYPVFAAVFLAVAAFIYFVPLPRFASEHIEPGAGALKYSHLIFGMIAIFAYVGGEVAVGSSLINFFELPNIMGLDKSRGDIFLAFYWGGAMIGRFMGAVALNEDQKGLKKWGMMAGIALAAFAVLYVAALTKSNFTLSLSEVWPFFIFIALNMVGFGIGKSMAGRTLAVFAAANLLLLVATVAFSGPVAFWSVIAIGLFNSIMWSNIFTLAIDGLGKYKSQGSSLLVMMVLGGALVPPLQGALADSSMGLHASFLLPMVCYAYLLFYGAQGYKQR
jgi:FHS family L-fucose permease-like MFS transporter